MISLKGIGFMFIEIVVLFAMLHVDFPDLPLDIGIPPTQQEGLASWYGGGSGDNGMHGRITATGETFNPDDITCASRDIPLNTIVMIEDVKTGNRTYCRVNDRGPYGAVKPDGTWVAMFKTSKGYITRGHDGRGWTKRKLHKTKPASYRGILDMSRGTAKSLGVDLNQGLFEIRIRYWVGTPTRRFSLHTLDL